MKHTRMWAVVALTAAAMSLTVTAVSAQVVELAVRVDGLSCPFCAYSLEKKLKNIPGVKELSINVSEGVATLTPELEKRIDIAAIPQVVESAGFTPREIQAKVRGSVKVTPTGAVLIAADGQTLFVLEPSDLLDTTDHVDGKPYELEGTVVLEQDAAPATQPLSLLLVSVTPRPEKDGS